MKLVCTLMFGSLLVVTGCAHLGSQPEGKPAPTAAQLVEVAELAERGGDPLRAQQYLLAALRAGADEARYVPRLLTLYVADGQYRVAIEQLENYLRRHPDAVDMRVLLSTLYTATGDDEAAIHQYEKVIARAPSDAYAHFALATLLHDRGSEAARADSHYRAYLQLAPRGPHADEARELLLTEMP